MAASDSTPDEPIFATDRLEKRAKRRGAKVIAGVDEAGRGPLAGPVVVAAVIVPRRPYPEGLTDSKRLVAAGGWTQGHVNALRVALSRHIS